MIYCFEKIKIDTCSCELLNNNKPINIKPLIFKLLQFMLENPNRVLSRDELISEVWSARVISDSALSSAMSAVRQAIGDTGKAQRYIKTVSGLGYRFIAVLTSVHSHRVCVEKYNSDEQTNINDRMRSAYSEKIMTSLSLPDKPSIAVMDFVAMDACRKDRLMTYSLTMEVNGGLSRQPHLYVTARASSAILAKKNLSPMEIGQRLGVRYLVYGHTEYKNKRIRVTLSIVDSTNNSEIASDHFDELSDDVFYLQNAITNAIVGVIGAAIEQAEIERTFILPTEDLSAWENYYRGIWHSQRPTKKDALLAHFFFRRAISIDPLFSRAYAGLANCYINRVLLDPIALDQTKHIKKASEYALQSIGYDRYESMGYFSLGRLLWVSKKHEEALNVIDQGLKLSCNNTYGLSIKSVVAGNTRHSHQALKAYHIIQHLSPFDPMMFAMYTANAISAIHQKKYDEAVSWSLRAAHDPNAYYLTYAIASASLELAGRSLEAKSYAKKTLKLFPNYSIEIYLNIIPHADEITRDVIVNAMINAGLPKTSIC